MVRKLIRNFFVLESRIFTYKPSSLPQEIARLLKVGKSFVPQVLKIYREIKGTLTAESGDQ